MKKQLLTLLLITFLLGCISDNAFGQTKQPSRLAAAPGDTVWVIVNYVKADKRDQFERFLHQIFVPGASKLGSLDQKVTRHTRILHPVAPEPNGSYAYIFIMDPFIPFGNYNIENLLTKMYGDATAKDYLKLFTDALASESRMYREVQSQH